MTRIVSIQLAKVALMLSGTFFLQRILIPYNVTVAAALFAITITITYVLPKPIEWHAFTDTLIVLLYLTVMTYDNLYSLWIMIAVLCEELFIQYVAAAKSAKQKKQDNMQWLHLKFGLQAFSIATALTALLINEHTIAGMRIEQPLLYLANVAMACAVIIGFLHVSRTISSSMFRA